MKITLIKLASVAILSSVIAACANNAANEVTEVPLRATGDMGVVIERATGQVQIVNHTHQTVLAEIDGLGDLSHASIVYSRDQRYAYVFGRDGGFKQNRYA